MHICICPTDFGRSVYLTVRAKMGFTVADLKLRIQRRLAAIGQAVEPGASDEEKAATKAGIKAERQVLLQHGKPLDNAVVLRDLNGISRHGWMIKVLDPPPEPVPETAT